MRPKDPLPNMDKSSAVYKIDCKDCSNCYIGETSKMVKTRVHEHRLAVRRGEQYSQIAEHMMDLGHQFDFENVNVLASDRTKGGRLLKEAWLSTENSINRHIELCPAYLRLRARGKNNPPLHQGDPVGMTNTPPNASTCGPAKRTSPPSLQLGDTRVRHERLRRGFCPPPPRIMGPAGTLEERRLEQIKESPSEEESYTSASPGKGATPDECPSNESACSMVPRIGGGRTTRLRVTSAPTATQVATIAGATDTPLRRPRSDGTIGGMSLRSRSERAEEITGATHQRKTRKEDSLEIAAGSNGHTGMSEYHKTGATRPSLDSQEERQRGKGLERMKEKRGKERLRGASTVRLTSKNGRNMEGGRETKGNKRERVDEGGGSITSVSARAGSSPPHPMAPSRQRQPMDCCHTSTTIYQHTEEGGNGGGGLNAVSRNCEDARTEGEIANSGCPENGTARLDVENWEERQGSKLERENGEEWQGGREEGGEIETKSVRAKDCHYHLRAPAQQGRDITTHRKKNGYDKLMRVRTSVGEGAKGNRSRKADTSDLTAGERRQKRGGESKRGKEGYPTPPPRQYQPVNYRNNSIPIRGAQLVVRSPKKGGDKRKHEGSTGNGGDKGESERMRNSIKKGRREVVADISPQRISDIDRMGQKRTQETMTSHHIRTGCRPTLPGPMTRSRSRMRVPTEP